ncbi:hypothetical protein T4D_9916 [Trichinella pseudospiralis]|uniref:Uncharacterized protein n=1 Tax=Trichinella pseudospiralis TaxID=6337 RepID=A0A0V1F3A6_TRIPS|nr:hypothetical protein T4D_9916 [Trichinella pseudospiralis]
MVGGGGGQTYGAIKFKSWESRMISKRNDFLDYEDNCHQNCASGFAACQLSLTCHLRWLVPSDNDIY